MSVPDECRSLIAELVFVVEGVSLDHKKVAFDRIRRRVLRGELKRLHKNNFESVNSSSDNYSTVSPSNSLSNYVSVNDFRPLEANYSSIKIIDYQTHGIKKDINSMLAKKIQYTSRQLLNKETFLENWMLREPSPDLKPEKYPLSDYAHKKISSYHEQALASVRKFTFTQFCKFNVKKKQGFFSLTESDPLKHKKTPLSASLTYMKDSENEVALQAFECLLRAGGEAQTCYNMLFEVNELVELMMRGNDNIKEEIFLQVIKQISSKKEIYLRILCCICYCVRPSTRIYIPLLNYLFEESTLYENLPKELLNYCFFHLIRNFDKERTQPPCLFELFCAFYATKIPITICFPREKVFFIESYTTVEELLSELIEYYNLDSQIDYLLEVNGFLLEKGNILDKLNYYCEMEEDEDYKWKDYQCFRGLNGIIVLKNVSDITVSPRTHSIMYNYCANQYIRGLYSLRSTDIVRIAALKMISEMDDEENYLFEFDNLVTRRKLRVLTGAERENYKKHILKQYYKLGHLNRIEARRDILEILSKNKGFNTHFFRSAIFVDDYDELTAWVGVQKDRFIIVEPSTGRIMRYIPFSKIKEWGKSRSELCLRVDDIGEFHIESKQVDVMASVFENYVNHLASVIHKTL